MPAISSNSTLSRAMELDNFRVDEEHEMETDDDGTEKSIVPVDCSSLAELLQVLQGEAHFWDKCPTPIPSDIWHTLLWRDFNAFRRRVHGVTIDKDVWDSLVLKVLEQIEDRLDNGLFPCLKQIDISWGRVVNYQSLKLFRSASVQTVSLSFEHIGMCGTHALRQEVHNALEHVARAFINASNISITFNPLGDAWLSLGPNIASDRFKMIKHASFSLPMGKVDHLGDLFYSIGAGLPHLVQLEVKDIATQVQPGAMTFRSFAPLLSCRRLQVVYLQLLFGLFLSPEAWFAMAFAWPKLTELTVHCRTRARSSIEPAHVGSWSSLAAIAAAPFLKLKYLCLPLALSLTSPPFPPIFYREFANINIECIGSIKAEHVDAGSQFLAALVGTPSVLSLDHESNEAAEIRTRVKDLVKLRSTRFNTIVSDSRPFPIPRHDYNRTKVYKLRVGAVPEQLPVVLARPSPEFEYHNLSTYNGLSDFLRDCNTDMFVRLFGQVPEQKSRFRKLDWQMNIGAIAVGVDDALEVDLWLPRLAWEPDLSMVDLVAVLGSLLHKQDIKIGITDYEISQCIQHAFDFALVRFSEPLPVHPCKKLVALSMAAYIID